MTINLHAFGISREIVGSSILKMVLADRATTGQLRKLLEDKYPGLKKLSSFMLALNDEYATGEEMIRENDEVAIIPPVSGG